MNIPYNDNEVLSSFTYLNAIAMNVAIAHVRYVGENPDINDN